MTSSDNMAMDGQDGPRRPAPSAPFPVVPFAIMALLVVLAFVAGRATAPEKQPFGRGGVTADDPGAKEIAERLLREVENKPNAEWTLKQERELREQRSKLTRKTRAELSERLASLVNAHKLKRVYPPKGEGTDPTWCPPPWGDLPECHKKEPPKEPPAAGKAQ